MRVTLYTILARSRILWIRRVEIRRTCQHAYLLCGSECVDNNNCQTLFGIGRRFCIRAVVLWRRRNRFTKFIALHLHLQIVCGNWTDSHRTHTTFYLEIFVYAAHAAYATWIIIRNIRNFAKKIKLKRAKSQQIEIGSLRYGIINLKWKLQDQAKTKNPFSLLSIVYTIHSPIWNVNKCQVKYRRIERPQTPNQNLIISRTNLHSIHEWMNWTLALLASIEKLIRFARMKPIRRFQNRDFLQRIRAPQVACANSRN